MTNEDAIWLIAGGIMQEDAAKRIRDLGYKLILTDFNTNCLCKKYADEFVESDTFDIAKNLKAADELKEKYNIKAVLTVAADCHETVAHTAKALGLHHLDPGISKICRYKILSREVLEKAGIPQPKSAQATSLEEARNKAEEIGYPLVIKASNNSGSRGFAKIASQDDLTEDIFKNALNNGTTGYVILEELMIPLENEIAEQSVETIWYDGEMYWLNWVDRLFRKDFLLFDLDEKLYGGVPWGIELGHINPAKHSSEVEEEVKKIVCEAGKAVGMDKQKGGHVFKADIMLTTKGPRIIEVTPRLSGGWDSSRTTPARGGDFIGGAIHFALGGEFNDEIFKKYFQYKSPEIYSTIMALIEENPKDCTARKYAIGSDTDVKEALKKAIENLQQNNFL